jgi:hypothetical protein
MIPTALVALVVPVNTLVPVTFPPSAVAVAVELVKFEVSKVAFPFDLLTMVLFVLFYFMFIFYLYFF